MKNDTAPVTERCESNETEGQEPKSRLNIEIPLEEVTGGLPISSCNTCQSRCLVCVCK